MTDNMEHANRNAAAWLSNIEEMLAKLDRQDDDPNSDDARREIEESVLSVSVRDGWHAPGQTPDDGPDEYEILLSTGGPALRLYGKLGQYCEPESAELQAQDWGTPWTRFPAAEDTLLRFAQCFYFGE